MIWLPVLNAGAATGSVGCFFSPLSCCSGRPFTPGMDPSFSASHSFTGSSSSGLSLLPLLLLSFTSQELELAGQACAVMLSTSYKYYHCTHFSSLVATTLFHEYEGRLHRCSGMQSPSLSFFSCLSPCSAS